MTTLACVYCLGTGQLTGAQVLLRGREVYLCAPRGQLVEGYLVIAPYRCIGCLADLPATALAELVELQASAVEFYTAAYRVAAPLFYEQGRAGGGAPAGAFPLHAHLCGLPLQLDAHPLLASRYRSVPVSGPPDLPAVAAGTPYAYLDSRGEQRVYLPHGPADRPALERLRLKPDIAGLAGLPGRGHWRDHPGDDELGSLIRRFAAHQEGTVRC